MTCQTSQHFLSMGEDKGFKVDTARLHKSMSGQCEKRYRKCNSNKTTLLSADLLTTTFSYKDLSFFKRNREQGVADPFLWKSGRKVILYH